MLFDFARHHIFLFYAKLMLHDLDSKNPKTMMEKSFTT